MKTRKNNLVSGFTLVEVIIALVVVAIVAAMMATYFGTSITQSSAPIFRLQKAGELNQIMERITATYSQYPHWNSNTTYAVNTVILPMPQNRSGLLYRATAGGTSGTAEPIWPRKINSTVDDGTVRWRTVWDSAHNTATINGAAPALILMNRLANTAYSKNTIVYPGNGYQYLCITSGTSGAGTPTWPITNGATVPDGAVTWQYIGYAPTLVLQTAIGTEATDYTKTFVGVATSYRVIQNRFIKFTGNTEVNINSATTDTEYGKYLKVTIGFRSDAANRTDETVTTLFVRR